MERTTSATNILSSEKMIKELALRTEQLKQRDEKIVALLQQISKMEALLKEKNISVDTKATFLRQSTDSNASNNEDLEPIELSLIAVSSIMLSFGSAVLFLVCLIFLSQKKQNWTNFIQAIERELGAPQVSCEKVKYIFADGDWVEQPNFEQVMKWFSPMYPNSVKLLEENSKPCFKWQDLVNFCSLECFFGFSAANDINKYLLQRDSGTFLIRFSSVPGFYTLSVNNRGAIGHWRIKEYRQGWKSTFTIDERQYASIQDIITTHKTEPLLVTAKSTQEPIMLRSPLNRGSITHEPLYSSFQQ
jgi:hypothetical protein